MLSKDGQVYPNNSILSLSEVFGTGYSLLCVTERRPCYSSSSKVGDWYYHNGTAVPSYGQRFSFYTSRGDNGTVRLHTMDNNLSLMNTSQFCCKLLNMNNLSQKLCVNICDSDCEIKIEKVHDKNNYCNERNTSDWSDFYCNISMFSSINLRYHKGAGSYKSIGHLKPHQRHQ